MPLDPSANSLDAGGPRTAGVTFFHGHRDRRDNVVLIAADTVRPDHLSCYGYDRPTSPSIDRLAAEGARFLDFQAAQIPTHPSFTTILSGVDPLYHRILAHSGTRQLPPTVPLLAERLKHAGYLTAGIDNMMPMESAPSWFARGFDYFRAYRYSPGTGEAAKLTDWALDFIETARDSSAPFFLFIHYFDPHTPYLPPPSFRRRFYRGDEFDPSNNSLAKALPPDDRLTRLILRDMQIDDVTDFDYVVSQYDAEIAFMDSQIGRLIAALDQTDLAERTLTIFLSDHGEAFGEGGLFFDHHTIHDAVTRCALVMRHPKAIPAGSVIDGLASSVDVSPTILEHLALPAIEPVAVAGRGLWPLIGGARIRDDAPLGEATRQVSRGIVTPEWRLIEPIVATGSGEPIPDFRGRPRDPAIQLFHRLGDPREERNVATAHPSVVADLRQRIEKRAAAVAEYTDTPNVHRDSQPSLRYDLMVNKYERRSGRR